MFYLKDIRAIMRICQRTGVILLLEIMMGLASIPIVVLGFIKKDVLEGSDKKKGKKNDNEEKDIELQEKNDE